MRAGQALDRQPTLGRCLVAYTGLRWTIIPKSRMRACGHAAACQWALMERRSPIQFAAPELLGNYDFMLPRCTEATGQFYELRHGSNFTWVVVKRRVPFRVPYIVGAVLY